MPRDTLEKIICPACNKKMHKIFLNTHGFNLDICLDSCGGMFFDNRELNKVDEQHENIDEILALINGKTFKPVDENELRICPACSANMHKNYTSLEKNIQIDECYTCGGKFLDAGELCRMRAEFENDAERAASVVNAFYKIHGVELAKLERDAEKARKTDTLGEVFYGILNSYRNAKF